MENSEQTLSLRWPGNRVIGAAAVCLSLEASIPEPSLFPNGNVGMPVALLHWRRSMITIPAKSNGALMANGLLISRQMNDGRPYLQGLSTGLADICAASWCLPHRGLFAGNDTLLSWFDRMQALTTRQYVQTQVDLATTDALDALDTLAALDTNTPYQGLLECTVTDGVTTITSPLDR